MKYCKVNFALVSNRNTANNTYYYLAEDEYSIGDIVMVESKDGLIHANFLGYTNETEDDIIPFRKVIRKANEVEIELYWELVEENLINNPLKVSPKALHRYRTEFKDNEDVSKIDAEKRLSRNILLCRHFRYKGINKNKVFTFYNGLQKIRVRNGIIISVSKVPRAIGYLKNWTRYKELNEKMGIKLTDKDKIKYGLTV